MSNAKRVETFIEAWNRVDFDAIYAMMSPDIVYHNIPWPPCHGLDAVKASLDAIGVEACEWTIHHIAEKGPVVLTERTDRIKAHGGWISVRVMGIFEFKDGLITAWRDYFDPAEVTPKPA